MRGSDGKLCFREERISLEVLCERDHERKK